MKTLFLTLKNMKTLIFNIKKSKITKKIKEILFFHVVF
jgi:hypothetical protein